MIGNFREAGYVKDAPSLAAAQGKRTAANKERVVTYLRAGTSYTVSPGPVADLFDPTQHAGTAGILTDGVYAWPHFLAYYVDRYDVELPAEFEQHMRERSWSPPTKVDLDPIALPWEI
jgi:hypothetical protein